MLNQKHTGPRATGTGASRVAVGAAVDGLADSWAAHVALVARVRREEVSADEELYRLVARNSIGHLACQVRPEDIEDRLHDIFVAVVNAIRQGSLREPARLVGFVRTVTQRQIIASFQTYARRRDEMDVNLAPPLLCEDGTFEKLHTGERLAVMTSALKSLAQHEREILQRFYVEEQSQDEIRIAMHLTPTQYRLLKSRAKAKCGSAVQSYMRGRRLRDTQRSAGNLTFA